MSNWVIKKLPEICKISTGKMDANHATHDGKYRFYTCSREYSMCDTQSFSGESIIVPGNGDIGLVFFYNGMFEAYQRTYVLQEININPKFLYYHMSLFWRDRNKDKQFGTTVKYVRMKNFLEYEVSYPTDTKEQEAIVSRIEELFSELDKAVETLQKTKQQLAAYRQAVLKEAFDSIAKECSINTIKSICTEIKVGIVIKPTQYYVEAGGVRAFRNANVRRNYIEDNDWAMISNDGHQKNKKSEVHTGNVLVARSGANLGMAAAVTGEYDGYNAIDVVIAVPKQNEVVPKYLAYFTNSPYGIKIVKENQHGAAQGHLNVKEYGNLKIPIPNIHTQHTLIGVIESRLSVCDSIEKTVDTALAQADAMRQSILKQAFEGRF